MLLIMTLGRSLPHLLPWGDPGMGYGYTVLLPMCTILLVLKKQPGSPGGPVVPIALSQVAPAVRCDPDQAEM